MKMGLPVKIVDKEPSARRFRGGRKWAEVRVDYHGFRGEGDMNGKGRKGKGSGKWKG